MFVVNGAGPHAAFWRRELGKEFERFRGRVAIVWLDGLSLPDLVRRCASLPRNSAIFFLIFGTDASGAAYADERVLADLHATANAPLFGAQSVYMGRGVVGGSMMPIDEVVRTAADAAVRLLNGAPPKSINLPLPRPGQPIFDWRELRRWGIRGEPVAGRAASCATAAPACGRNTSSPCSARLARWLIQSLLIVGLLYQRRARRQAESDSQRHLALAADASRRQTMSALTTSIAHELGQPLSSMIHNAEALRAMIDADRAPSDTMKEILTDIRTQSVQAAQIIERHRAMLRSHQLQRKPIDLHAVVHESLALVAHDLKTREIETTVDLSSSPCVISGDPVLLQQVLVNLMMNAIDAMAETPKARRRLTIATAVRAADVELSVRDSGTGLPPHVDGTLFTPFVTTKPHGLGIGLTIARTIVDAHGGTIDGRNNPERGATFTVTLRLRAERRPDGLPIGRYHALPQPSGTDRPDAERFQQVLVCRPGGLPRALRAHRIAAQGPSSQAHPHVQQILLLQGVRSRQPGPRLLHRQLPGRPRRARRQTRERRPGRRHSNRVRRRTRTRGRRLHPIHLRQSFQAGAHRDGRRPCGGLRAQVSTAALSRHTPRVRVCRPAIPGRRAPREERDGRRRRQRFSSN